MDKKVVTTALIAGVVGLVCTIVFQQLIPIRDRLGYREVPNEGEVLAVLDANLRETAIYLLPGHSPPDALFRERYEKGPIFRIHSLQSGAGGAPHVFIPILALLIGGWLAFKTVSEKGPTITISFATAEGLEAGKTKIKYKDVEIGKVESIKLNPDLKGVLVTAELNKDVEKFLTDKTPNKGLFLN